MFMGGTDLALRMIVTVRTSSTRGARLGTRAGTCRAENEPEKKFESSSYWEFELKLQNLEPLICSPADLEDEGLRDGLREEVLLRVSLEIEKNTHKAHK